MTYGTISDDERIKEEICECLSNDPNVDASAIEVVVKDGEVTLEGIVGERIQKYWAEDAIDNLPGVSEVHNRIRVQRGLESILQVPFGTFQEGERHESHL